MKMTVVIHFNSRTIFDLAKNFGVLLLLFFRYIVTFYS